MRRSAAPSFSKQGKSGTTLNQDVRSIINKSFPQKSTLTRTLELQAPKTSGQNIPKFCTEKRYEVVYAKRSTKKHKKWEDDGMLILSGLHARICSTDSKTIASTTLKGALLSTIELGMILIVGSYECQLISEIDEVRKTIELEVNSPSQKSLAPVRKSLKRWKYNADGLPVVDVYLGGNLASKLHPYQLEGIKFLYECVLGYRKLSGLVDFSPDDDPECVYGGILADEMGLGKTVQVIGLLSVLLKQGPYGGRPVIRRCLIVTPGSLVMNWQKEFNKWIGRENISTYCVSQDNPIKAYLSQMRPPPVIIISYEMFLQHADRVIEMSLIDLVVCDEGHRLKNLEIKTTVVLKRLPARRRILLTGTPIQNDLNEFWSLAEFVAPGCLASSREEYRTCIVNPLSRSSRFSDLSRIFISGVDGVDDEESDVLNAVHKLNSSLKTFLLRRTSDMITNRLPDKVEQIIFCEASPLQREVEKELLKWLYKQLDMNDLVEDDIIDMMGEDTLDSFPQSTGNGLDVLTCIMTFRKLYNHPSLVLKMLDEDIRRKRGLNSSKKQPFPDTLADNLTAILHHGLSHTERTGCSSSACTSSGKLAVLQRLLTKISQMPSDSPCRGGCHRLVLVSNFTKTLDLLEPICERITNAPCLRIDGKTPTKQRLSIVDRFNSPTCIEKVLLLSSKAGGTGLNLIGADFLVLFDIDWNPATDAQALARVWREGQKRRVHLIRLITADGLEERILQRQVAKSSLASTAISASFASSANSTSLSLCELRELFQPSPSGTVSWTHDLLGCQCQSGPSPAENFEALQETEDSFNEEEETRAFQLGRLGKRAKMDPETLPSSSKGLGQIKSWSHFLTPETISEAALLFSSPHSIKAVFQHVTSAFLEPDGAVIRRELYEVLAASGARQNN
nr:DNA repair and recombination protein RAD54B [Hymenolepis microstoma]